MPSGRRPGTNTSTATTHRPTIVAPTNVTSVMFASSAGRSEGERAANTLVAEVTPRLASWDATSTVVVMNATVPRSVGPSARASSSTAKK